LDKPLDVIYKVSKLAYRISVILIANERVKKNCSSVSVIKMQKKRREEMKTVFRELIPSLEASNWAITQEFRNFFSNPNVHYRVHKSPPQVFILNQINEVHTTPTYLFF
jgi:hypothetical protein